MTRARLLQKLQRAFTLRERLSVMAGCLIVVRGFRELVSLDVERHSLLDVGRFSLRHTVAPPQVCWFDTTIWYPGPVRRLTAQELRETARACRIAAEQAKKDAEKQGGSSTAENFRLVEAQYRELAVYWDERAKERE